MTDADKEMMTVSDIMVALDCTDFFMDRVLRSANKVQVDARLFYIQKKTFFATNLLILSEIVREHGSKVE